MTITGRRQALAAVYRLTRQYLSVVSYASLTRTERVVGVPCMEVEEAATRLQGEGVLDIGAPINGLPGAGGCGRITSRFNHRAYL
jgi:hypothetical protein